MQSVLFLENIDFKDKPLRSPNWSLLDYLFGDILKAITTKQNIVI